MDGWAWLELDFSFGFLAMLEAAFVGVLSRRWKFGV